MRGRRVVRWMCFTAGCLAAVPGAAAAGSVAYAPADAPLVGPVLAGQGTLSLLRVGVRSQLLWAPASGSVATLLDLNGPCASVERMAGSPTRVAVLVRRLAETSRGCEGPLVLEVLTGEPGGPLQALPTDPDCRVTSLALDGDRLLTGSTCAELVVRNLGAPPSAVRRIALRPSDSGIGSGDPLAIRGRWVGYLARGQTLREASLVALDGVTATEVTRLPVGDLLLSGPQNFTFGLALDADGTLAASLPVFRGQFATPTIVWATPGDPVRHTLAAETRGGDIALAGGLIAVTRGDGKAVIELRTGADRGLFSYDTRHGLDFDGRQVAWAEDGVLRREAWPRDPGPRPGLASQAGPGAEDRAGNLAPKVELVALASSTPARALRDLRATASDRDGRIASVRFGVVRRTAHRCSDLTAGGRLLRLPPGRCTPRHRITAKGKRTFVARLRRPLPAGRYVVFVSVRDNRGKLSSTRRSIRLRH